MSEILRTETPEDIPAIRNVHLASFPAVGEADLVDALRHAGNGIISLVAEIEGAVVGHVMCSPVSAPFPALGLAPVAVLPDHRQQGVADRLIRRAIKIAQDAKISAMFVLGNPNYYGRFGFDVSLASGYETPYAGPHFMVKSLTETELVRKTGQVSYALQFDTLD